MSVIEIIRSFDKDFHLEASYFIDQLKTRWSDVHIHFIQDERAYSLFQWRIMTGESTVLGDFYPEGISFQAHSNQEAAKLALWYRKIIPPEFRLIYLTDSLNTAPFELQSEMTEEDIVRSFNHPFDLDDFERLVNPPQG